MTFFYLTIVFLSALGLAIILTCFVRSAALRLGVMDYPDAARKNHAKATPLLGGTAIFLSFFIVLFFARDQLTAGDLDYGHWLGFFAGACFLMIGGFLDDKYNLSPRKQIIFPVLAIIAVIAGGVGMEKISNPLGGFIALDSYRLGFLGGFFSVSGLFIFMWLLGMMYTTKLLDGVDGLVTGVSAIGAFIIFLFTMTTRYYQPDIGLASLAFTAAALGFLFFNWHPAKIFLGDGGSLFLGYALGVLAVISGGKIAIALLVMGIPIMDAAWTIARRLREGKNPFRFADRKHLHFRIMNLGLSARKTAVVYYAFAAVFGLSALFLQSLGKTLALAALVFIMFCIIIFFGSLEKKTADK